MIRFAVFMAFAATSVNGATRIKDARDTTTRRQASARNARQVPHAVVMISPSALSGA
jgi:hypothetical protein